MTDPKIIQRIDRICVKDGDIEIKNIDTNGTYTLVVPVINGDMEFAPRQIATLDMEFSFDGEEVILHNFPRNLLSGEDYIYIMEMIEAQIIAERSASYEGVLDLMKHPENWENPFEYDRYSLCEYGNNICNTIRIGFADESKDRINIDIIVQLDANLPERVKTGQQVDDRPYDANWTDVAWIRFATISKGREEEDFAKGSYDALRKMLCREDLITEYESCILPGNDERLYAVWKENFCEQGSAPRYGIEDNWLHGGQRVKILNPYFEGQFGVIRSYMWNTGNYIVTMEKTGHDLPFHPSE